MDDTLSMTWIDDSFPGKPLPLDRRTLRYRAGGERAQPGSRTASGPSRWLAVDQDRAALAEHLGTHVVGVAPVARQIDDRGSAVVQVEYHDRVVDVSDVGERRLGEWQHPGVD